MNLHKLKYLNLLYLKHSAQQIEIKDISFIQIHCCDTVLDCLFFGIAPPLEKYAPAATEKSVVWKKFVVGVHLGYRRASM